VSQSNKVEPRCLALLKADIPVGDKHLRQVPEATIDTSTTTPEKHLTFGVRFTRCGLHVLVKEWHHIPLGHTVSPNHRRMLQPLAGCFHTTSAGARLTDCARDAAFQQKR